MSKYEHFGPPEAPGPFGGFSGPPSQGPTEGSREPRRGAGPAERRRRARSVEGRRRVKRPEMSSPGHSQLRTPDAIRQDRLVGRRGVARRSSSSRRRRQESRLGIRYSKLTTVKKFAYEFLRSNQEFRTRPPSADLGREISKSLSTPQPQREREFLTQPLDT